LELCQIRYALFVAKERSFTRASERLWVAQPGLSTQIRRLESELGARGVKLYPAAANFVCAEVGDGAALAARLEREGVIVRPLAPFGAPSCVRVTVGLRDENDVFLTALDRSLQPA